MSDKRQRIHLDIISETGASQFLSEKSEMRGGITVVMLTSSSGFAAEKWPIMSGKLCLDEF